VAKVTVAVMLIRTATINITATPVSFLSISQFAITSPGSIFEVGVVKAVFKGALSYYKVVAGSSGDLSEDKAHPENS
jgi:hypothetical protein